MRTLLIIEDDKTLNQGLAYDLKEEKYHVCSAFSKAEAEAILKRRQVDLILLDVNLPDGNGFELCRTIKKESNIPIIFLTARDLEGEQIKGFELGAEDYITKPFSMKLLRKRIEVAFRHSEGKKSADFEDGYLTVDFEQMTVLKITEPVLLTPLEFKLLKVLIEHKQMVLTKQMLLEKIWDVNGNYVDQHAVAVNINRLRGKIEDENRRYIKTIYGMGYQWMGSAYE